MKRYTEEHEWVVVTGDLAVVGITAFAAEELGDITYVELPAVGKTVKKGESLCVIESVKAASDVFSPVSGAVAEVNGDLENDPGIVNASPEEKGWICKMSGVSQAEVDKLMTAEQYAAFTATKKK
jgi:glycine cleavage system H protein